MIALILRLEFFGRSLMTPLILKSRLRPREITVSVWPTTLSVPSANSTTPLSSPKTLWVFKNPREAQARAILDLLDQPRYSDRSQTIGVIVGGDFNTVRSGADEPAIQMLKAWSTGLAHEDPRDTHMMGRLDYLFFNLPKDWSASTERLDERFGSDHFPVLGTLSR